MYIIGFVVQQIKAAHTRPNFSVRELNEIRLAQAHHWPFARKTVREKQLGQGL